MTDIYIRQSGGANIVSIPKAIVQTKGLKVGSKSNLSIKNNSIILSPKSDELSLEALLAESPRACFKVTDEDREWIDAPPLGKEV